MAEKFEIGEVAIYVRPGSPHYGREVTVTSGLQTVGGGTDHITGEKVPKFLGYKIDGIPPVKSEYMCARPEWLRKKKPPRREIDQIVSWEDCLWKPETLGVQ